MANADKTAAEVNADLIKVDNFIKATWNAAWSWLRPYLDRPVKKLAAIVVAVLVIWMWGYAAAAWTWHQVPEGARASVYGVMPATNNDIAAQDDKIATRADALAKEIEQIARSIVSIKATLTAIVTENGTMANRVDALESRKPQTRHRKKASE